MLLLTPKMTDTLSHCLSGLFSHYTDVTYLFIVNVFMIKMGSINQLFNFHIWEFILPINKFAYFILFKFIKST